MWYTLNFRNLFTKLKIYFIGFFLFINYNNQLTRVIHSQLFYLLPHLMIPSMILYNDSLAVVNDCSGQLENLIPSTNAR